ncbi:alanine racemase [Desulfosarcina sp.]|uniref:alanine racemase n=1 Tax=Desulfosarcina sp. TaxID=2027861 RepID=UPI003970BA55
MMTGNPTRDYLFYRNLIKGQRLPLALIDLDCFDANVAYVAGTQKHSGKTIRVASKSIRCLDLIRRVFEKGGSAFKGILAFTVEEGAFLADHGFDDIIVAYPTVQPSDMELMAEVTRKGIRMVLVVDSLEHLRRLAEAGQRSGVVLKACLEIDMSFRPVGRAIHLGVRRSPLRQADQAVALARRAAGLEGVKVTAVMGYEAQIASVNDSVPGQGLKNALLRKIKQRSMAELMARRKGIIRALKTSGCAIDIVNGGGSGSLKATAKDGSVTEVTAGSAFFAPGLFRHFHEVTFQPAAFFALQVVRTPAPGMVTCLGGGYVASGEIGRNKLPWPVMPPGLRYIGIEGAGEVQTPLKLATGTPPPDIGDPVFFQHAKAGELCERFNHLILIKDDRIIDRVPTYRGQGYAFL